MIQCRNCGTTFPDNAKFCGKCGAQLYGQSPPLYVQKIDDKEPFLAIIFSLILSGLGQIYCGRIARGLVILLIGFLPTLYFLSIGLFGFGAMMDVDRMMDFMFSIVVVGILSLIFWIWQVYDAYSLAVEWNETVERTHQKPW